MTFTFPPKFPATLARRPFVIKSLLAAVSLIGLSVLYVVVFIVSRLVGLTEDSPLSSGISVLFFIAAIFLIFGVFFYILGLSASRCRSIGLSPWWCLIYFVPYVNVLIWLALALWPSKSVTTATETLSTPSNAASSDSVAVPLVPLEQGQKPSASKK